MDKCQRALRPRDRSAWRGTPDRRRTTSLRSSTAWRPARAPDQGAWARVRPPRPLRRALTQRSHLSLVPPPRRCCSPLAHGAPPPPPGGNAADTKEEAEEEEEVAAGSPSRRAREFAARAREKLEQQYQLSNSGAAAAERDGAPAPAGDPSASTALVLLPSAPSVALQASHHQPPLSPLSEEEAVTRWPRLQTEPMATQARRWCRTILQWREWDPLVLLRHHLARRDHAGRIQPPSCAAADLERLSPVPRCWMLLGEIREAATGAAAGATGRQGARTSHSATEAHGDDSVLTGGAACHAQKEAKAAQPEVPADEEEGSADAEGSEGAHLAEQGRLGAPVVLGANGPQLNIVLSVPLTQEQRQRAGTEGAAAMASVAGAAPVGDASRGQRGVHGRTRSHHAQLGTRCSKTGHAAARTARPLSLMQRVLTGRACCLPRRLPARSSSPARRNGAGSQSYQPETVQGAAPAAAARRLQWAV